MFIYNTKNALTSDALKKLSAVASFSQKVKLNSKHKSSNRDKTDIRNSFCPTFTWIVRDFSLKTTMTAREKLERFLEQGCTSDYDIIIWNNVVILNYLKM